MNRKNEILNCATDLIQTFGFNGFSYKDISAKVGITTASIHHHYASKEELGIAYCEFKYSELSAFREKIRALDKPRKQLEVYLNKPLKRLESKKMCGINAMQSDCSSMTTLLREEVKKITKLDIAIVTEILEKGEKNGDFGLVVKPLDQAEMIVSALKGALQRSLLNSDNSYKKVTKTIMSMLINT